jgi:hypothetical protein
MPLDASANPLFQWRSIGDLLSLESKALFFACGCFAIGQYGQLSNSFTCSLGRSAATDGLNNNESHVPIGDRMYPPLVTSHSGAPFSVPAPQSMRTIRLILISERIVSAGPSRILPASTGRRQQICSLFVHDLQPAKTAGSLDPAAYANSRPHATGRLRPYPTARSPLAKELSPSHAWIDSAIALSPSS